MIPVTSDSGFYEARNFNQIGNPLVRTEARSKLTPLKWDELHRLKGIYDVSIKTDGKFVRIIKKGSLIRMITSSGLDFYHNRLAELMAIAIDGQYNMELQVGDGLLRSRDGTGYLTTACTEYRKQLPDAGDWPDDDLCFQAHDFLPSQDRRIFSRPEGYPLGMNYLLRKFLLGESFICMFGMKYMDFSVSDCLLRFPLSIRVNSASEQDLTLLRSNLIRHLNYDSRVHEGLVFMGIDEPYRLPINPNNFKLKNVQEVKGTVIGVEQDKNGGNGTLILEVIDGPPNGQECRVSSGIDNKLRSAPTKYLMNKRVEVEYESITADGHYNQPRIKRFDI